MGYVKQEGAAYWSPEKAGDELEGEVTAINTEGLYGAQYTVKKADGEEFQTPSHKMLQSLIVKAALGTKVKIVYKGDEPAKIKGRSPTKLYEVFFDK